MTCSPIKVLLLAFVILFLISCTGEDKQIDDVNTLRPNVNQNINTNVNANNNSEQTLDDSVKLAELITIPYEPEESIFRVDKATEGENAETEKETSLTAVIKFSDENAQQLLADLQKTKSFEMKIEPELWFPAELVAKSELSGDQAIKGTGFNADKFFKPPYNAGSVMKIEGTNYFVLILKQE